jgi:hypothetical protein
MIVSMTHSKKQIRKRKRDSNDAMLAAVKKEMANLAWPSRPEDLNRLDRRLRIEYSHGKFFRINLQQGLPIAFSSFGIVHVAHGRPVVSLGKASRFHRFTPILEFRLDEYWSILTTFQI